MDNNFGVGMYPMAASSPPNGEHYAPSTPGQENFGLIAGQQQISSSRTVYLGNVPQDISEKELLDYVRSGTVESVKIIPSKSCAFISFLDQSSALLFHSDAILKRLTINDHDIRIGWGKNSLVAPMIADAVNRYNATRNVYLGGIDPRTTEKELHSDLSSYGTIDTIKILPERRIAFIHFTTILSAIRVVQNLALDDKYQNIKVSYGKDRCAFITKTQQHNAAQYLGIDPNFERCLTNADREYISTALIQQANAAAAIATQAGGANNLGNRTIYLGNLHPECTCEEICNVVRGGILQAIRLIQDRHVCFVTFIDPVAAAQFFAMSALHGLVVHNRKIKVGWGKHSGPLPNALNLAVGNGASRNIYVGGLDLRESATADADKDTETVRTENGLDPNAKLVSLVKRLRLDFEKYGEIEQINLLVAKKCAFVNFCNIANAIAAIDSVKKEAFYRNCKINFGKDRCGNIPRQFSNAGRFNEPSESTNDFDDDYFNEGGL